MSYCPKQLKGVVLAGGSGSRLAPLTLFTNKHLLPVYDQPMICYPLKALANAGINEVMLVTNEAHVKDFIKVLEHAPVPGIDRLEFAFQQGSKGIADALRLAREFSEGCPICVILGDNIIENNILYAVDDFRRAGTGAHVLLKEVPDPERFGCPELRDQRIVAIEEKPRTPKSGFAVTGIYLYDETVFEKIDHLQPSWRGELEITDVNNQYIAEESLSHSILQGWWTDAGTFESLLAAWNLVATTGANKLNTRNTLEVAVQEGGLS